MSEKNGIDGMSLDEEFTVVLEEFVDTTRSMSVMLPELITFIGGMNSIYRRQVQDYQKATEKKETLDSGYIRAFDKLKHSFHLYNKLPASIFISIVCQLDYLIVNLIRMIYLHNPEIIQKNEKNISLSEIEEFETIEDFKNYYIDKDISNLTYKGLKDIYSWFQKRLSVDEFESILYENESVIEIIQRRHIFVHNGGKVTRQYLRLSKNPFSLSLDQKLTLSTEYIAKTVDTLQLVGVKTLFMVWYSQNKSESLFTEINDYAFKSIKADNYVMATNILEFGLSLDRSRKVLKDDMFRMLSLNLAQAYKWSKQEKKCSELLKSADWTAVEDKYKLGFFCLSDDFINASKVMTTIGSNGTVKNNDYLEWPIFKEFRKSNEFQKTYKAVFNKEYSTEIEEFYEGIEIKYVISKSQEEFKKLFPGVPLDNRNPKAANKPPAKAKPQKKKNKKHRK